MKLIKPSYEIWEQEFPVRKLDMSVHQHQLYLLDAMYRHIERCGRTCYKSENLITEESAKPFVDRMIKSKHYAMLEHGTVYLNITVDNDRWKYENNPHSKANGQYVTTNFRVIVENGWEDDLQYMCCPTEYHEKRYCVHLVTNIHVYKDLTRHRSASFAIESTRYCNYTKGKFGRELTFIIPNWCKYIDEGEAYFHDGICYRTGASDENPMGTRSWTRPRNDEEDTEEWDVERSLIRTWDVLEREYMYMIEHGWKAQQAATILPQSTKADVIITSFASHWEHIFALRTSTIAATGQPHPQVAELMDPLYEEFKKLNYIGN